MRIALTTLVVLGLLSSAFLAQAKEEPAPVQAPQTIEEAREFGLGILQALPSAMKQVWQEQALPLWTAMRRIAENLWSAYVFPWLNSWSERVLTLFGQEVEKRKPSIEQEFERQRGELQEELEEKLPDPGKTLWDYIQGALPFGAGKQ